MQRFVLASQNGIGRGKPFREPFREPFGEPFGKPFGKPFGEPYPERLLHLPP